MGGSDFAALFLDADGVRELWSYQVSNVDNDGCCGVSYRGCKS